MAEYGQDWGFILLANQQTETKAGRENKHGT